MDLQQIAEDARAYGEHFGEKDTTLPVTAVYDIIDTAVFNALGMEDYTAVHNMAEILAIATTVAMSMTTGYVHVTYPSFSKELDPDTGALDEHLKLL